MNMMVLADIQIMWSKTCLDNSALLYVPESVCSHAEQMLLSHLVLKSEMTNKT